MLIVLFGTHRRVTLDGVSNPRQCQESMLSSHGKDVEEALRVAWYLRAVYSVLVHGVSWTPRAPIDPSDARS